MQLTFHISVAPSRLRTKLCFHVLHQGRASLALGHSQPGQHTSLSLFQAFLGHLKGHPHVPAETVVPQPRAQDQLSKCLCWHLPLLHSWKEQGCPAINQPCSCSVSAAQLGLGGYVAGKNTSLTPASCSALGCLPLPHAIPQSWLQPPGLEATPNHPSDPLKFTFQRAPFAAGCSATPKGLQQMGK